MRAFLPLLILPLLAAVGCDSGGADPDPEPEPDPTGLVLRGQHDPGAGIPHADIWGYVDPATGKEYALLGTQTESPGRPELFVFDVSDPTTPEMIAGVDLPPVFDVKTWGHYAYTVVGWDYPGDPLGRIVDLSDPTAPEVVGSFPSSHNLFIDERGVMYLEGPGLRIFDLRDDPLHPILLWSDNSTTDGHDATVVGTRLYDFHGDATHIYDVTDPAQPQLLGTITHPQIGYHHSGWPTEDGHYLYLCDEAAQGDLPDITVWDIRNPERPERVATYTDPASTVHNLYIVGDRAYVSYYASGLRLFDVSDPTQPRLLGEHDTTPDQAGDGFFGAWGVYPFTSSGLIFVSDVQYGFFLFDFVDP